MSKKQIFFSLFLSLVLSSLLSVTSASAQTQCDDPNTTIHELCTPTPSQWEPLYHTATPGPEDNLDFACPADLPEGYGTVTPSAYWELNCGYCLDQAELTATARAVPTGTPDPNATPGVTATPGATATLISGGGCGDPGGGSSGQIGYYLYPIGSAQCDGSYTSGWSSCFVPYTNPDGVFIYGYVIEFPTVTYAGTCNFDRTLKADNTEGSNWLGWAINNYSQGSVHIISDMSEGGTALEVYLDNLWYGGTALTQHYSNIQNGLSIGQMFHRNWYGPDCSGSVEIVVYAILNGDIPATAQAPCPTATPGQPTTAGACGVLDDGLSVEIELPTIMVGTAVCALFGGFDVDVSLLNLIPGLDGLGIIEVPGFQICARPISFGHLNLLGMDFDMDAMALLMAMAGVLRMLLRS